MGTLHEFLVRHAALTALAVTRLFAESRGVLVGGFVGLDEYLNIFKHFALDVAELENKLLLDKVELDAAIRLLGFAMAVVSA